MRAFVVYAARKMIIYHQKPSIIVHASLQEKNSINECTQEACITENHFYPQNIFPIGVQHASSQG